MLKLSKKLNYAVNSILYALMLSFLEKQEAGLHPRCAGTACSPALGLLEAAMQDARRGPLFVCPCVVQSLGDVGWSPASISCRRQF